MLPWLNGGVIIWGAINQQNGIGTLDTPLRIINSVAPIRICDNGGWTDTWFAEHGKIFNIGVNPYAEVQIEVYPITKQDKRIELYAENFGECFVINPEARTTDNHQLLEVAFECMQVPDDVALRVTVYCQAPSGASTGTSAAVAVALVGALDRLTEGRMSTHEVAYTAQSLETQYLRLECGIQDQLCSAYGGINFIDMYQYPYATVSQIQVPSAVRRELERRLVLIFLGQHDSSAVHKKVIGELEDAGPTAPQIQDLRKTAEKSRDAVYAGDFEALGQTMIENTEAQFRLNSALVSADARRIIAIAQAHGAIGWKVNGAGGEGGSLTLLSGPITHQKRTMIREIEQENDQFKHIPVYLNSDGLRTWETSHHDLGNSD